MLNKMSNKENCIEYDPEGKFMAYDPENQDEQPPSEKKDVLSYEQFCLQRDGNGQENTYANLDLVWTGGSREKIETLALRTLDEGKTGYWLRETSQYAIVLKNFKYLATPFAVTSTGSTMPYHELYVLYNNNFVKYCMYSSCSSLLISNIGKAGALKKLLKDSCGNDVGAKIADISIPEEQNDGWVNLSSCTRTEGSSEERWSSLRKYFACPQYWQIHEEDNSSYLYVRRNGLVITFITDAGRYIIRTIKEE